MGRVGKSRRRWVMGALAVIGVINAVLFIRPFEAETIEPVPIAAAIGTPAATASIGVRSYLGFVKAQAASGPTRDSVHAALMFMSYFLLSTRAMEVECGAAGADFGAAKAAFAVEHAAEYDRASRVLAGHGLNSEVVWSLFNGDITTLAKRHVSQFAERTDGTPATACGKLAANPTAYAVARRFAAGYPGLHQSLMR